MIAILTTIATLLGKVLNVAVKVALSRITFSFVFIGTIGGTIALIFTSLSDQSSFLNQVINGIQQSQFTILDFVLESNYLKMICHCLAIDTAFDVIIDILFVMFVSMIGFLAVAWFGVIFAVLPLLAEVIVSAIKKQMTQTLRGN